MYANTREWWNDNCHLSGEELARKHGGDGGNWRRRIRKARRKYRELPWRDDPRQKNEAAAVCQEPEYRETIELRQDGSCSSDKLLRMDANQCKDTAYLLQAHGFDEAEWEVVTAKNNLWNVFSKGEDGEHVVSTLYSSKITVRPRRPALSLEDLIAAVRDVKTVRIDSPAKVQGGLLEAPLFDMHFGTATLADYADTRARLVGVIRSRTWDEVVLPVGSDLLHHDNFRATTANGTQLHDADLPQAWADAAAFFSTAIEAALEQAARVVVVFVIGNHDESMSWAFCQMLAAKYPQVDFDLDVVQRKVHRYGDVCVGFTHGDKAVKEHDRVFLSEFPAFASAAVREIHTGHFHHEVVNDRCGVIVRSLSSAAPTDRWHHDNGYVGSAKRFALFEYAPDALLSIRYV